MRGAGKYEDRREEGVAKGVLILDSRFSTFDVQFSTFDFRILGGRFW